MRLPKGCRHSLRLLLRTWRDDEIDLDLEVVRADRHFEARCFAAGLLDDPRDRRFRQAEETQEPVVGAPRPGEELLQLWTLDRRLPDAPELTGRARERDRDARPGREEYARSGAGQAERDAALRKLRLLPDACLELGVRAPETLCEATDDPLDLADEIGVHVELAPGSASQQLERSVVVRWPETAGCHDQVEVQGFVQRSFQLLWTVADHAHPLGLDAAQRELASEKRPVLVDPPASDELAARNQDGRSWGQLSRSPVQA